MSHSIKECGRVKFKRRPEADVFFFDSPGVDDKLAVKAH